ncbi:gephyrin-like molybdotransferase Glp [Aureimonas leprariae]|uniref:molybdopterin molybdotransferase MoeA n=1 Tax=Plantimonas leprariae TaxID=2615207 RepID=UPI001FE27CFE|nr:gephyrin-like molybdotransferase Glp [Aureimonas leprariae]
MISVEEAFARIVGRAEPLAETETVPLRQAFGRVLARDLVANRTQPGFPASAMDGYAVRAADCAAPFRDLRVIGESAAGRSFDGTIAAGECVRIFTGAPVPKGADAILIQENAERTETGTIRPTSAVDTGRHIRRAGADFASGDVLVSGASRFSAGRIALAASGGHPSVEVVRRPRVAILATGDELVLPGEPIGPSQIVASNTFGIAAIAERAGAELFDYGIARDDEGAIGALVDRAAAEDIDILVTIGGASVGDHDLVGEVFASRGVALDFWKVAMRPGKPLMAGRLGAMHVLGLPGNPASSMVTATLFLKPLVQALGGVPNPIVYREGVLGAEMAANDERADYIRATLDEASAVTPIVNPFGRQDSSLLSVFAAADALLLRPPHAPAAQRGDLCRYIALS